jgi:hypothetical protein
MVMVVIVMVVPRPPAMAEPIREVAERVEPERVRRSVKVGSDR